MCQAFFSYLALMLPNNKKFIETNRASFKNVIKKIKDF